MPNCFILSVSFLYFWLLDNFMIFFRMEDKEKENKSKDQLSGEDNKKTKETSDHNIEDVSKGMPDVTDKEQQQNVDEVALLDETGDSETVIPVSSSSEKVNNADSSDILNTSNESEATEPAMGSFNKGEETKDVLKEKLSRFLEWCIVNGLVLSNKVILMFSERTFKLFSRINLFFNLFDIDQYWTLFEFTIF